MTVRKREGLPRQDKDASADPAGFSKEPYSGVRLHPLREKHRVSKLSMDESLELLLRGNAAHADRLLELKVTPADRYAKIGHGEADYLVIACSDSRLLQLDSEEDTHVGIQIRVAGNVIPKRGTPSFEEIRQSAAKLHEDGLVIIEGHIHCGAVNERVKWVEGGMKPTGSAPLDNLLHEVFGSTPSENALAQLTKARQQLHKSIRDSGAVVYDWEHGKFEIIGAENSPAIGMLVDKWKRRHAELSHEMDLKDALKKQKPHAIAVGEVGLPYSLMTVFHAKQNEVFATSGSENGLDDMDEASILYAVEHLGVRHIPFVAPGTAADNERITKMFGRWEADLRGMTVHGEHILSKMLDSGQLRITRLRYDLETGKAAELAR